MACRKAYRKTTKTTNNIPPIVNNDAETAAENVAVKKVDRLFFGVNSKVRADERLQNNLDEFEWATRNKLYPNFWGRNINGDGALTRKEIEFLRDRACKIAPIYLNSEEKKTEEQGRHHAKQINVIADELGIPLGTAIFLEIKEDEPITRKYLLGFAKALFSCGYVPGFRANTDAAYDFDCEYSRGMQTDPELFGDCLIWAVAPSLAEYDRVTTTHLIHPDNWKPYAPSGIKRTDIAIWQYGKDCHPIDNDDGIEVTFNIDLVRDEEIIIKNMF